MDERYFVGAYDGKHFYKCECGMFLVSGTSKEHLYALLKVHQNSKYHIRQIELQNVDIPESRKRVAEFLTKQAFKREEQMPEKEEQERKDLLIKQYKEREDMLQKQYEEREALVKKQALPIEDKLTIQQEEAKDPNFLNRAEFKQ